MHSCHMCKEETALGDVTLLERIIATHTTKHCIYLGNLLTIQIS